MLCKLRFRQTSACVCILITALAMIATPSAGVGAYESEAVSTCAAFDSDFIRIPGRDACLRIGGEVSFELEIRRTIDGTEWSLNSSGNLYYTAKLSTDHGELTGYADIEFEADEEEQPLSISEVYIELGNVLVGKTDSAFAFDGGFNYDSLLEGGETVHQVSVSVGTDRLKGTIGLEAPQDRWDTDDLADNSTPDLVGVLSAEHERFSANLLGAIANLSGGFGSAAQANVTFDVGEGDDQMRLLFGAGHTPDGISNAFLDCDEGGRCLHGLASYQHYWSDVLSTAITYAYVKSEFSPVSHSAAGNLVWEGPEGFTATVEGRHYTGETQGSAFETSVEWERPSGFGASLGWLWERDNDNREMSMTFSAYRQLE